MTIIGRISGALMFILGVAMCISMIQANYPIEYIASDIFMASVGAILLIDPLHRMS